MSTTADTATEIHPFQVDIPEEELAELRNRLSRPACPPRSSWKTGRRACSSRRFRSSPAIGHRVRLAPGRGEAERLPAVHDRDRRGRHPLHPRQVSTRERAAADHDARVARVGHRAARRRRPAHRSDRARRERRGRVRPRAAVDARLRLLRRADRGRLGPGPHRAGMGGADAPAWLHPLRRPGRRRGRLHHRRDGRLAPEGLVGIHTNLLVTGWPARLPGRHRGGEGSDRAARYLQGRAASATSSSRPRGRRRSATRCSTRPSPWRPGCSTTTRTPTRRSPAPSSTSSRPATSRATTSSTTSRCTG